MTTREKCVTTLFWVTKLSIAPSKSQLNNKEAELKQSDISFFLQALCQRGLRSPAIWMKYLIVVWCRQTEDDLYPLRIPGHFLSLCSGNGPGWHRPCISTQSTHCCLCGKAIALTPSFPSLCARSLWQEKRLWHLERCLYVWLCVGAAVQAWSGWWDAGKSTCCPSNSQLPPPSIHPSTPKREALFPLRIAAVYVEMGVLMQIMYWQRRSTLSDSTFGPGRCYNLTKTYNRNIIV